MRFHCFRAATVGSALLACSAWPASAHAAEFRLFPGPNGANTYAQGISADGRVVVGQLAASDSIEAFYATTEDGVVSLGDFPGGLAFGTAYAANQDGSVIVGLGYRVEGSSPDGVQVAFRWTAATGLVDLGDLPGGEVLSFASDISNNGNVIVGAGYPAHNDFVAWRWENGVFLALGTFDASSPRSAATSVSADGTVVVGSSPARIGNLENTRAFRWTESSGLVDLGDLPGGSLYAYAAAVSLDGQVAVGSSSSSNSGNNAVEACRWAPGQAPQPLGDLPGGLFASDALATNQDGSVVVGRSVVQGVDVEEAFLWTSSVGMRSLRELAQAAGIDLGDAVPRQATAVSADGQVVAGIAETPTGLVAFRLDLHDSDAGPGFGAGDAGSDGDFSDAWAESSPADSIVDDAEVDGTDGFAGADSTHDTGGCGCTQATTHTTSAWVLASVMAAATALRRRRPTANHCQP